LKPSTQPFKKIKGIKQRVGSARKKRRGTLEISKRKGVRPIIVQNWNESKEAHRTLQLKREVKRI